jgi:uncharacterized protein
MKTEIEERLKRIVEISTKKAAINEWKEASETQSQPLYNYRLDHIEEVVVLAKHLASDLDVDMDVLILSAWLHDLAKPGVGGISAQHHGVASAMLAEDILTEEGIDSETISKVSDVIRKHVGLTLKEPLDPIEAQIIWEADKILKLGIIGFIQGLLNGVRLFPGRGLEEIAENLNEFLPLATDIVNSMETKKGKELANERLNTLKLLIDYLDRELEPIK